MAYQPRYTISARVLFLAEEIAALRERIRAAMVDVPWIPALQKDARSRNVHASTAIEGNPLTLEQVRAIEEGRPILAGDGRAKREVLNYLAGLRYVEKRAGLAEVGHDEVRELHRVMMDGVMEQGEAGRYRVIGVRVGAYLPPEPEEVPNLMSELLEWWNREAPQISCVLSSAILHYRFEAIHPFADGNGRTGRALAVWEFYRRGFDSHHIFAMDEYFWEDRPAYTEALDAVRRQNDDLTQWLEYSAEGVRQTLERAWLRVQLFSGGSSERLILRPQQEKLLRLLHDHGGLAPSEIWEQLGVSRQGAMNLLRPLLDAGLVEKVGGKKSGRYVLRPWPSSQT